MIFSPQKQKFIDSATEMFGAGSVITNKQIKEASAAVGIPRSWLVQTTVQNWL